MQAIEQYLSSPEYLSLAKESRRTYIYALERFGEYLTSQGENDITTEIAMKHRDGFVKHLNGLSGTSIKFYCQVVRIVMASMKMPVPEFTYKMNEKQRRTKNKKQEGRWLTQEDVDACLAYTWERNHIRNHCIVRLLAETGMRVQELKDLLWKDVNTVTRTCRIDKSKTTVRTVVFSPATADALNQLAGPLVPDTLRIFTIDKAAIQTVVSNMLRDLGIKTGQDGKACHIFRHWAATNMYYNGGMALEDVAKLLGDKPQTIFNTYLHPTDEMMAKRVEKAMGW